ncbi:ABC transporter [Paenibacillus mucilaginosus 3016]|uniref:ABC transporter n=1 Tax=Paenibacillus mucilaginosus 3016 TaxID=1116391 RepID=H6NH27_9BACL|nr:ATP-binding cassette domain-containing protein [Paenibacillus mucilaginosus]AFC28705.1 ABC transporter [Paenibacillus mucilaginosus 3016]WFA17482.1 ATP-binding cassette domain-containing protein [Paenibacillus mucilaginosus]
MKQGLALSSLMKQHGETGRILFSGISAEAAAGESVALLGGSGQGKSTLLRILAWLESADGGFVAYEGRARSEWKPSDWRRRICYVAQQPVMLPGTVEDNLRTASRLHRTAFDEPLARRCMEALGLGGLAWSKKAGDLSGGEKQRTALVRSLLLRPEVLLLDEVTASLDPGSKSAAEELLAAWRREHGTCQIWVTHDLRQAREACSRVWLLADGALQEDRPSRAFFEEPATEAGRSFLGAAAEGEGEA